MRGKAPPLHDKSGHTWQHPDFALFRLVRDGIAAANCVPVDPDLMPRFKGVVSDSELVAILSYIKSTRPESIRNDHDQVNMMYRSYDKAVENLIDAGSGQARLTRHISGCRDARTASHSRFAALPQADHVPPGSQACYQSCQRWRLHQVRHRRGSAAALVAAIVLVLQSFLSVWAAGAMPATPMLDAFGNPPCITSVDHDGSAPASDHSKLPDCCTFGCNLASPLLAAEPADGMGLLRPLSSTDVRFHFHRTVRIQSLDHDPGSPRAPPLTA